MSLVESNGIKLCHESTGDEFPVILIHGYGSGKEIWKPQVKDLSKRYRVITFDMRGAGGSDRPNFPYTMDILADDIKGLMDGLGIERAHVGGRSLGGMIGQNFTLKYPNHVEKLILITTNAGMPTEEAVDMMRDTSIEETKLLKEDPEKAFWQKAKLLYHRNFRKEMEQNPSKKFFDSWSVKEMIENSLKNPPNPEDLSNIANAMKTHHTEENLKNIKHPTLLIAASHDRLTPKSAMMKMHENMPNSTLKVIEKAGHYATLSRADEINEIILDFLKESRTVS